MNEEISRIDINNVNYKLKDEDTRALGEMGKQALIKVGYYVCSTPGSTAAKTINATDYTLSTGGCIKVKMDNANTVNDATLNINSTGAKPLYYAGERASANNSWDAGETVEVYYDGTNFYANNVAGGSGSGDGAFDVSAKYPTSGVEGGNTYTLAGALAVLNANLSAKEKKGGMSIKFVQSSDNKYVQYRLISEDFTNDITQWYSVDIEPLDIELNGKQNYTEGGYIKSDGFTIESNSSYGYSDYIDISSEVGNKIRVWTGSVPSDAYIFIYDANGGVDYYGVGGEYRAFTVPDGYVKMRFSFNNSYDTEVDRNNSAKVLWKKQRINGFITNTQNELEIPGRDIVRKDLVKQSSPQVISDIIKDFGNKIAIRILNNDSILFNSAKIKANLYSGGSAFTGLDLTDEWTYWESDNYIDKLYLQTTGEVTSAGSVIIEIAYGDYYNMVFWKNKLNLGSISLARLNATKTIMFDTPINFIELSKIKVKVSNLVTSSAHPFVYLYGIYSSDGNIMEKLVPITENTKENSVYSYGYDTLYGLYFWNHRSDAVSFDAEILMEDVDNATQQLVSFDDLPMLPSYYKNYINKRQNQIRDLLKSSIINGDAFIFITDTHWEFNAKNSPAIIKELNKQLNIPRLFHGGDMYNDGLRDDKFNVKLISLLKDAMKTDKVYETYGNHEFIHELATYGDVFAETRIFLDDVVFGGTNKNYYYVDNKQKKIRYINLYSFGEYVNGSITMGLTDVEQQAWFRDVALNVEGGWGIFIFSHTICDYRMTDNTVFDYPGATAIYDIINNYQGNGTILAFIIGHLHADCVVLDRCKCPIIITTCDHNFPLEVSIGGDIYYDFSDLIESRDSGTIKEQAFDVVVYNKNNMTLNFVRIGSRAMNRSESFAGNAQVDIRTVLLDKLQVGNTLQVSSVLTINSWETSNNSVASVSNGIITANAAGYVVITGTAASGEKQSWFIKVV